MDNQQPSLEAVLDWAKEKIAAGAEPPWAWFQYMKLIETLDAILNSQASVITKESSQQLASHQAIHLRLVVAKHQRDTVQSHPGPFELPLLPM